MADPPIEESEEEVEVPVEPPRKKSRREKHDEARMPFLAHLRELQVRVRNSVIALLGGFIVAYSFKQELLVLLLRPLMQVWKEKAEANPALGDPQLNFGSVIEPFWTYFSISIWAGIFIASPFIFHQLWKFIAPGLYKHERRYGVTFGITSAVCFIGGAVFCYFLVLPAVFDFLLGYATTNIADIHRGMGVEYNLGDEMPLKPMLMMQEYLKFTRKLLIGFGIVFELPLLIFFLSLVGAVTHRKLWKFNRWWIVLSFVISAALTPPDIVSQMLMAGPLIVLYNLSIIISWIVTRRRERRQAELDAD